MSVPARMFQYAFAAFRFDPETRRLSRDERTVRLGPRAADVLLVLLENAGRMVPRDELIAKAWNGTSVERQNLTVQIHEIRDALGDDPDTPSYIQTITRRGYQFICPVTIALAKPHGNVDRAMFPSDEERSVARELRRSHRSWFDRAAVGGTLLVIALLAGALIDSRESPLPQVVRITQLTHDGKSKGAPLLGDGSLYYKTGRKQHALRLESGVSGRVEGLDAYDLRDISLGRGEALAFRPDDRGAETALWIVRLDGSTPRRVGAVVVSDQAAAWSHDGKRIAYGNEHTVYVTDTDGALNQKLASFTGQVTAIQWAPSDRSLRVDVSERMNRTATYSQYDVMVASGDAERVVTVPSTDMCCGTWLLGSNDYVFTRTPLESPELWLVRAARGFLLRRPPELRRLTSSSDSVAFSAPVSSSDGSTIYALGVSEGQLSTYDGAHQAFLPYLGGVPAIAVSFSPDQRSLAYIKPADHTLWRANADGTQARQLTFAPWYVDALAWSPDSARLAIRARDSGQHTKIHLLSSQGGRPEPIDPRDLEQGSPTWSPDGAGIAFGDVPEAYGMATGSESIHLYNLAERVTTDVPGSEGLWSSRWSPNGRYLAATRIADRRLMLYDFASTTWRDLGLAHVGEATWLNDTSILAEPEWPAHWVMRVHVPDGRAEPLLDVEDLSLHSGAGVSLDGRPLFLRATTDIYAVQLTRK